MTCCPTLPGLAVLARPLHPSLCARHNASPVLILFADSHYKFRSEKTGLRFGRSAYDVPCANHGKLCLSRKRNASRVLPSRFPFNSKGRPTSSPVIALPTKSAFPLDRHSPPAKLRHPQSRAKETSSSFPVARPTQRTTKVEHSSRHEGSSENGPDAAATRRTAIRTPERLSAAKWDHPSRRTSDRRQRAIRNGRHLLWPDVRAGSRYARPLIGIPTFFGAVKSQMPGFADHCPNTYDLADQYGVTLT